MVMALFQIYPTRNQLQNDKCVYIDSAIFHSQIYSFTQRYTDCCPVVNDWTGKELKYTFKWNVFLQRFFAVNFSPWGTHTRAHRQTHTQTHTQYKPCNQFGTSNKLVLLKDNYPVVLREWNQPWSNCLRTCSTVWATAVPSVNIHTSLNIVINISPSAPSVVHLQTVEACVVINNLFVCSLSCLVKVGQCCSGFAPLTVVYIDVGPRRRGSGSGNRKRAGITPKAPNPTLNPPIPGRS